MTVPQTVHVSAPSPTRLVRFERAAEWPMALLATVFLVVYAVDVLAQGLSQQWHTALRLVDYVIWGVFAGEFLVRVALAQDRVRYAMRHVLDVLILVLPFLRALRVLRLVFLLRALNRWAIGSLRGRLALYGIGVVALFVFCGALAVFDAERNHADANIRTFGDAVWWSATTIFTVGYGDRVPITVEGRVVAICLMASGVALVGAVAASFATWLIERVRLLEEIDQTATRRDLHALHARLERLEGDLAEVKHLLLQSPQGAGRADSASS